MEGVIIFPEFFYLEKDPAPFFKISAQQPERKAITSVHGPCLLAGSSGTPLLFCH